MWCNEERDRPHALAGTDERKSESEVHGRWKMDSGARNVVGSHPSAGKSRYCVSAEEREGGWIRGRMKRLVYAM